MSRWQEFCGQFANKRRRGRDALRKAPLAACFDAPRPDLAPVPVAAGTFFVQPTSPNVIRAAGLSETGRD